MNISDNDFFRKLKISETYLTMKHIALDTVLCIFLLLCLSMVHNILYIIDASEDFKAMFTAFHEHVFLAVYSLVAISGLLHIFSLFNFKYRIRSIFFDRKK